TPPTPADSDHAWALADELRGYLRRTLPPGRRLTATLRPPRLWPPTSTYSLQAEGRSVARLS
ncbi:hypothetical protein ABGB17_29360, partial [Sphaerisporangium sp. B11E5]|uniref:hypothetical protein n=1 Tax=Sphaerisporangium sp. B11E5 TaxID=3153563 RepID=UPI00325CDF68